MQRLLSPTASRSIFAGVMLTLFGLPTWAHAQSSEQDARQRYKEGEQLFNEGRYAEASSKFRQAYAVWKSPSVIFSLGVSVLEAGAPLEALGYLREYLANEQVSANGKERAQPYFERAYERTGHLLVQVENDGSATVDGAPVKLAPAEHDLEPGEHVLACSQEAPKERRVTVNAGVRTDVDCTKEAPVAGTRAVAPPRETRRVPVAGRPVVVGILGGLAVASLGAGAVTYALGASAKSDARDENAVDRPGARERAGDMRVASIITTYAGVGLAVAAIVPLFAWPKKTVAVTSSSVKVTPVVGLGQVGLSATF